MTLGECFQVDGLDDSTPQPEFTVCHQPSEKVTGTKIPAAWFAHGLRLIDIADPRRPCEVGHFLPDVPEGSQRVQSNDITTEDRSLFYLLDRLRGLTILERCWRVEDARECAGGGLRHVEPALDSAGAVGRNGLPI